MDTFIGKAWTRFWEATFARKDLEQINRKNELIVQKAIAVLLILMAIIAVITFLPFSKGG